MDLDDPRELEFVPMDADDGAVPCRRPYYRDSAKMSSPDASDRRMPPDAHPRSYQIVGSIQASAHSVPSYPPPGCGPLSGSDGSPQLTISLPPSDPVNRLGDMADYRQNHEPAGQHRSILRDSESSVRETATRKRKYTDDSSLTHIMDLNHTRDNDVSTDAANSNRRIRPRLWAQQDREFSPLLYVSPGQERDFPVEETNPALRYRSDLTDLSHSIRRCFHLGSPREHDPYTSQDNSFPMVIDPGDRKERRRSDSASSFAEVALASRVTHTHGRLSTLQDIWLPRPFQEIEQQPSLSITMVHERGLDAGPSFPSTNPGRVSGLSAFCEPTAPLGCTIREYGIHAYSPPPATLALEPGSTNFFDKPVCDSPDSIDTADEDGLTHIELPVIQVTRARFSPASGAQSARRVARDSDVQ